MFSFLETAFTDFRLEVLGEGTQHMCQGLLSGVQCYVVRIFTSLLAETRGEPLKLARPVPANATTEPDSLSS
jgi:hypothetical protein